MAMELQYFGIPALGEPGRMCCVLGDLEWTDDRFGFDAWEERKAGTKWGQVPVLKLADGRQIAQSKAIARYLGKLVKVEDKPLYPEDPLAAAFVDDIMDFMSDIHTKMYKTMQLPAEEKEAGRQALLAPEGEATALLKMLEANVGDFAVGDSITLADLFICWYLNFLQCGFWDGLADRADLIFDPYPKMKGISEKVKALPKLREYYTKTAADSPMYKCYI
jgi:glutathione S-transferase